MQPDTPWKPDLSDLLPNRCFLVRFVAVHLLDQLHVQLPWQLPVLLHVSQTFYESFVLNRDRLLQALAGKIDDVHWLIVTDPKRFARPVIGNIVVD